jgi:hypothetical protein
MDLWRQYPLLGVGPGGSNFVGVGTTHTEFSRLPAEHGAFGFLALLLMLIAAAKQIHQANTLKGKAIAVCLIGWSFLYMLNAAMRLVAPAFLFGLAFATILPEVKPNLLSALLARLRVRRRQRMALKRAIELRRIPRASLR